MSEFTLIIGNKNYSSWSLRPWLAMKVAGITFEEVVIPLRQPETAAAITRHSPAGKVPILKHGARVLWESIAILEYLAEMLPNERLWPADVAARAHARVISAEMHAGFQALRSNMPMDVRTSKPGRGMNPDVAKDIARITDIWHDCRARFGGEGPFLLVASATPMRCGLRWSRASRLTALFSTKNAAPIVGPSSICRRCRNGMPRLGRRHGR